MSNFVGKVITPVYFRRLRGNAAATQRMLLPTHNLLDVNFMNMCSGLFVFRGTVNNDFEMEGIGEKNGGRAGDGSAFCYLKTLCTFSGLDAEEGCRKLKLHRELELGDGKWKLEVELMRERETCQRFDGADLAVEARWMREQGDVGRQQGATTGVGRTGVALRAAEFMGVEQKVGQR